MCNDTSSKGTRFPTRVIDVSLDLHAGPDYENKVRLVQGESCSGSYAALSYCWGGERDLLLTHETEQSLRQGLPSAQFPGTLRDAILVSRQLGIRYLWIDAVSTTIGKH